ncbi:MAG: acyl-CoA dehydrogenase family protein [Burkholderiaceae bacterium]
MQAATTDHETLFDERAEQAFRAEIKAFVRAQVGADIRARCEQMRGLKREQYYEWQQKLVARGWGAVNWPARWGGTNWGVRQQFVFDETLAQAGAPHQQSFNTRMIGPILLNFGTPEQQERFLPDTLTFDKWWCQGYSEPGSGSDLASLRTRADRDGDHYVVNGSKIWTSHAHYANWIFCLVRTDTDAPKQQGISFLLIDLSTPGVSMRPVPHFYGAHIFNQVFFENVRVPVANRVGDENAGWTVAKALLEHERLYSSRHSEAKRRLQRLRRLAARTDADGWRPIDDARWRERIAWLAMRVQSLEYLVMRGLDNLERSGEVGPFASTLKLKGIETNQAVDTAIAELLGPDALAADAAYDPATAADDIGLVAEARHAVEARYFFRGPGIAGGSNEIQRGIIAKRVLDL